MITLEMIQIKNAKYNKESQKFDIDLYDLYLKINHEKSIIAFHIPFSEAKKISDTLEETVNITTYLKRGQ